MFVLYHHYGYGKKHLMHTAYKQSPKMAGFGNPRDGWLVLAASLYIYIIGKKQASLRFVRRFF